MLARTGEGQATEALYSAFISYSHHDRAAATRLQRWIERYRLPRHLRRRGAAARLKPVFRDRDELTAAPDLTEAVRAALRQSEHLIVICTPAAAASAWVGREIAYFREVRDGGVLTALCEGESAQAMHAALYEGGAHPLAADFRRGGDGRRLALLKLIAPLAGVRLDELVQRDAQRRIRQIATLAAAAVVLVVASAALVLVAMQARAAADREQARGADAMRFQLTDLRRKLEAAGRLDLLAAVNRGVERYCQEKGQDTLSVPALLQCAARLHADAKDAELRDDLAGAHRQAMEAWRLTASLAEAYPGDGIVLYTHAQSEYYMGFADWRLGDVRNARLRFERYAALAQRLTALEPRNPDWLAERAYAASNLGTLALRAGTDTRSARQYFTVAQADLRAVARLKPGDADVEAEVAEGEAWLADVDRVAGDLPGAVRHWRRQHAILAALLDRSPRDARLRTKAVASALGLARVEAAQGRYATATSRLNATRQEAAALAAADPDNQVIARQRRAVEVFMAQTWLDMSVGARPSLNRIAAMLGDCEADWHKARNDELAALCDLTRVRLLQASRLNEPAGLALNRLSGREIMAVPGLSERWRLDLQGMLRDRRREMTT